MKKVEANVTIKFKRSNDEKTYKQTYFIENGRANVLEEIKRFHLENGNHNVVNIEILSSKIVSYYPRATFKGYLIKKAGMENEKI